MRPPYLHLHRNDLQLRIIDVAPADPVSRLGVP
jgi:hypothetical protein